MYNALILIKHKQLRYNMSRTAPQLLSDDLIANIEAVIPIITELRDQINNRTNPQKATLLIPCNAALALCEAFIANNQSPQYWQDNARQIKDLLNVIDGGTSTGVPAVYNEETFTLASILLPVLKEISNHDLPLFSGSLKGTAVNALAGRNKQRFVEQVATGLRGQMALYEQIRQSAVADRQYPTIAGQFSKLITHISELLRQPEMSAEEQAQVQALYRQYVELQIQFASSLPYLPIADAESLLHNNTTLSSAGSAGFRTNPIGSAGRRVIENLLNIEFSLNKQLKGQKITQWSFNLATQYYAHTYNSGSHQRAANQQFDELLNQIMQAVDRYNKRLDWSDASNNKKSNIFKPKSKAKHRLLDQFTAELNLLRSTNIDNLQSQLDAAAMTATPTTIAGIDPSKPAKALDVRAYGAYKCLLKTIHSHNTLVGAHSEDKNPLTRLSLGDVNQLLHHFMFSLYQFFTRLDECHDPNTASMTGAAQPGVQHGGGASANAAPQPNASDLAWIENTYASACQLKASSDLSANLKQLQTTLTSLLASFDSKDQQQRDKASSTALAGLHIATSNTTTEQQAAQRTEEPGQQSSVSPH